MQFLVLGNATVDEAMPVATFPSAGQTITVGPARRDLGGKGANQALLLKRAGVDVRLIAPIGMDGDGDWIAAELASEGFSAADLLRLSQPTDRSLIFVDPNGENAIASTVGCATALDAPTARRIVAVLQPGDVLVLQGNLTLEATGAALDAACEAGVVTVLNPSPVQSGFMEFWPHVDILILNAGEALLLSGTFEPEEAVGRLHRAGVKLVVLTLGAQGSIAFGADGLITNPSHKVDTVDTTGAGDTFAAILVAALFDRHLDMAGSLSAASRAASITVTRHGTRAAFPTAVEIAAILPPR